MLLHHTAHLHTVRRPRKKAMAYLIPKLNMYPVWLRRPEVTSHQDQSVQVLQWHRHPSHTIRQDPLTCPLFTRREPDMYLLPVEITSVHWVRLLMATLLRLHLTCRLFLLPKKAICHPKSLICQYLQRPNIPLPNRLMCLPFHLQSEEGTPRQNIFQLWPHPPSIIITNQLKII